jgi:NitT/TauT family transport system ATP-binding protein
MELKVNIQSFKYDKTDKKDVLSNISFEIKENETIAILGQSGCGKSTLLKIICGLLPSNRNNHLEGTISFGAESLKQMRIKGEVGYIFQEVALLPFYTVKENIELPTKIVGGFDKFVSSDLLEKVGLSDKLDIYPSALSGGMKTRVGIARAFSTKPKIVLMDEPFSSLDVCWKNSLCREISTLQEDSKSSIILVTHDIFEAIYFSDTIIILSTEGTIKSTYKVRDKCKGDNYTYHDVVEQYSQNQTYRQIISILKNETDIN